MTCTGSIYKSARASSRIMKFIPSVPSGSLHCTSWQLVPMVFRSSWLLNLLSLHCLEAPNSKARAWDRFRLQSIGELRSSATTHEKTNTTDLPQWKRPLSTKASPGATATAAHCASPSPQPLATSCSCEDMSSVAACKRPGKWFLGRGVACAENGGLKDHVENQYV